MNPTWRFADVFKDHRNERRAKSPYEFTKQDRSHLAGRISLAAYDLSFAMALRGMGQLVATDRLEVAKGFRPLLVHGVRDLGTQAAHRGSGCTWVRVAQARDPNRFKQVRGFVPPRYVLENGTLMAPLHFFAASKAGSAMVLGSERAATLLPEWENRLNSYMEMHGERYARNELLQRAIRLPFPDPAIVAVFTLEQLYGKFIPDLVKIASRMVTFYTKCAKTTGENVDESIAGHAVAYRDFIEEIARQHEIPPVDPASAVVPSATFVALGQGVSAFVEAEQRASGSEKIGGWTEKRVRSVDLIMPDQPAAS